MIGPTAIEILQSEILPLAIFLSMIFESLQFFLGMILKLHILYGLGGLVVHRQKNPPKLGRMGCVS